MTMRNSPTKTETKPKSKTAIDPRTLMRIKDLELRAKHVVEGFCSGLNRSPYHGFFGRIHRVFVNTLPVMIFDISIGNCLLGVTAANLKRFEDETNLRCHLLVDLSRSMSYGSLEYSKSEYARTLAATLGLLSLCTT